MERDRTTVDNDRSGSGNRMRSDSDKEDEDDSSKEDEEDDMPLQHDVTHNDDEEKDNRDSSSSDEDNQPDDSAGQTETDTAENRRISGGNGTPTQSINSASERGHRYINIQPIPVSDCDSIPIEVEHNMDSFCGVFTSLKSVMRHLIDNQEEDSRSNVSLRMGSALRRYKVATSSRFHVLSSESFELYTWYGTKVRSAIPLSRFNNLELGSIEKSGIAFSLHQYIVNEEDFFGNSMMVDAHMAVIIAALNSARVNSRLYAATHEMAPHAYRTHSSNVGTFGEFHIQKKIEKQMFTFNTTGTVVNQHAEVFLSNYEDAIADMCRDPEDWKYKYETFLSTSFQTTNSAMNPENLSLAAKTIYESKVYTITAAGVKATNTGEKILVTTTSAKYAIEKFMDCAIKNYGEWASTNFAQVPNFGESVSFPTNIVWSMDLACNISPRLVNSSLMINAKKSSLYMKKVMDLKTNCK